MAKLKPCWSHIIRLGLFVGPMLVLIYVLVCVGPVDSEHVLNLSPREHPVAILVIGTLCVLVFGLILLFTSEDDEFLYWLVEKVEDEPEKPKPRSAVE